MQAGAFARGGLPFAPPADFGLYYSRRFHRLNRDIVGFGLRGDPHIRHKGEDADFATNGNWANRNLRADTFEFIIGGWGRRPQAEPPMMASPVAMRLRDGNSRNTNIMKAAG